MIAEPSSMKPYGLLNGVVRVLTACGCLLLVTGCVNDDFNDLQHYIKEVHARPKGAIKPLPEIKVVKSFIFQPEGLRDPFHPIELAEQVTEWDGDGPRPDASRRKEELESFALDTLKMVGTVYMNSELWGLVMVGDGSDSIYRVRAGNYMGKNDGRITHITENSIELTEIVPDKKKPGTWMEQQASLVLTE